MSAHPTMPKREDNKNHEIHLRGLLIRDGDICLLCQQHPVVDKTVDHVNSKKNDWSLRNLALLCRSCNGAEGARHRNKSGRIITPENILIYRDEARQKLLELNPTAAPAAKPKPPGEFTPQSSNPTVDRRGWGSSEEAANLLMEPVYRLWVFNWVDNIGSIEKPDAIDAGAEYLDQTVGRASQQTVERYFRKIISAAGWLEECRGEGNVPAWGFRAGIAQAELKRRLQGRVNILAPRVPVLEREEA